MRDRPDWIRLFVATGVVLALLLPLSVLLIASAVREPTVFRTTWLSMHTWTLVGRTLWLALCVIATCSVVALPVSWLINRADLPGQRFLNTLVLAPLALPGYLLAYLLLTAGGDHGTLSRLLGVRVPWVRGFAGAWLCLSVYNLPYLLITLCAAWREYDPRWAQVAASLGHGPIRRALRVQLRQILPAYLAGVLLISLHVVNDFGVVSLMQVRTLTFALFQRYEAYQLASATAVATVIVTLASLLVAGEWWVFRGNRRPGVTADAPAASKVAMGWARWPLAVGVGGFFFVVSGLPVALTVGLAFKAPEGAWQDLWASLGHSVQIAAPTAVACVAIALALTPLRRRRVGSVEVLERVTVLGYATPPLALALALILGSLELRRHFDLPLDYRSSLMPLMLGLILHFLAEAAGPLRASMSRVPPELHDSARALGAGRWRILSVVTLPLIRNGMVIGLLLVFLSTLKELPLTLLLRPLRSEPFDTLATRLWSLTSEAMYEQAAPHALAILILSLAVVAVVMLSRREEGGGR